MVIEDQSVIPDLAEYEPFTRAKGSVALSEVFGFSRSRTPSTSIVRPVSMIVHQACA